MRLFTTFNWRLSREDGLPQSQAPDSRVETGDSQLSPLLRKLSARDWRVRWEACKALGELGDRAAAEPLVRMLQDDDISVRWAAMGSLILLGRAAIQPLMQAITRDFSSSRLRQGAHHVLHTFHDRGLLTQAEEQVFRALEGMTTGIPAAGLANQVRITQYIEVERM